MTEKWKIQQSRTNKSAYHIVSNKSQWFIAEELLFNNAMTIITHFNEHGPVKLNKNGEVDA